MATQQLIFLDENYQPFNEDPMRSFHDGHRGDSHEQLMFLRNKDPSVYYTWCRASATNDWQLQRCW